MIIEQWRRKRDLTSNTDGSLSITDKMKWVRVLFGRLFSCLIFLECADKRLDYRTNCRCRSFLVRATTLLMLRYTPQRKYSQMLDHSWSVLIVDVMEWHRRERQPKLCLFARSRFILITYAAIESVKDKRDVRCVYCRTKWFVIKYDHRLIHSDCIK